MFLLMVAPTCLGLGSWPSSGCSLVCAAYMSTYMAEFQVFTVHCYSQSLLLAD